MVPRTLYLERIRPFYDSPLIKVIVGVRRCGKSVLLQQIASELGREAPASLIVFIDFDDYANRHLLDPEQLHEHIISQIDKHPGQKAYLLFDQLAEQLEPCEHLPHGLELQAAFGRARYQTRRPHTVVSHDAFQLPGIPPV